MGYLSYRFVKEDLSIKSKKIYKGLVKDAVLLNVLQIGESIYVCSGEDDLILQKVNINTGSLSSEKVVLIKNPNPMDSKRAATNYFIKTSLDHSNLFVFHTKSTKAAYGYRYRRPFLKGYFNNSKNINEIGLSVFDENLDVLEDNKIEIAEPFHYISDVVCLYDDENKHTLVSGNLAENSSSSFLSGTKYNVLLKIDESGLKEKIILKNIFPDILAFNLFKNINGGIIFCSINLDTKTQDVFFSVSDLNFDKMYSSKLEFIKHSSYSGLEDSKTLSVSASFNSVISNEEFNVLTFNTQYHALNAMDKINNNFLVKLEKDNTISFIDKFSSFNESLVHVNIYESNIFLVFSDKFTKPVKNSANEEILGDYFIAKKFNEQGKGLFSFYKNFKSIYKGIEKLSYFSVKKDDGNFILVPPKGFESNVVLTTKFN
mgnify:CR=1 FL=1